MTYTGDVTPEAPVQTREVTGLSITKLLVGGSATTPTCCAAPVPEKPC